jgi:transcriptional regulatory protein RtcR
MLPIPNGVPEMSGRTIQDAQGIFGSRRELAGPQCIVTDSDLSNNLRMSTVLIGLIGSNLDIGGGGAERWNRWRPTVSLCQHEDLLIDRLELLHQERDSDLVAIVREDIRSVSPETEVRPHQLEIRDPWDFDEVFGALHDFARAYPFDPEREDYLVHITTGTHVVQICLFLLTESRHFPARLIQTAPPRRLRSAEPGMFKIIDLDLSKYDRLASRFARERQEATSILKSGIETRNPEFNRLIDRIEQVASSSKAPILLTGPTGAGKSQLAQRIYELKRARRQIEGRFVEVNCATLRGDGAMSSLFGHVKGAFTGALQDRAGLLKAADGGTLFLDEIAELGSDEQAMLLRAIEEKRFMPMGSDREANSDFQLIAGSNRDLQAAVQSGSFRDDLLARIDLWAFRLPGLRERREDIAPNLEYELEQHTRRTGARVTFNREAKERFLAFTTSSEATWERNFRDLSGAITRMCTVATGGRITVDVVNEEIARLRRAWSKTSASSLRENLLEERLGSEAVRSLDLFDRMQLANVIEIVSTSRSLSEAGRVLFANSREKKHSSNDADRLRKYLARFGVTLDLIEAWRH